MYHHSMRYNVIPYTLPEYNRDAFNCPYCGAFAVQTFSQYPNKGIGHATKRLRDVEPNFADSEAATERIYDGPAYPVTRNISIDTLIRTAQSDSV